MLKFVLDSAFFWSQPTIIVVFGPCFILGAFLLPYFISVIVTGIPMFFLEVSIGQLMSRGGIEAWELIPLFKGKLKSVMIRY